jgi:hypothetical protein
VRVPAAAPAAVTSLAALGAALTVPACGGSKKPAPAAPEPRTRIVAETEPDDSFEIESSRGHMDPAVIEAGIGPHKDALGECYTSRVGQRRWLGGRVSIHWDIQRDGTITAVKLAESDLGAWPIEKCLLETARGATFGAPKGNDTDFSIPLEFSARGKYLDWDEDTGRRAVGSQLDKLDACTKVKGVTGPSPEDVVITIYVGAQGKPQSAGFASSASVIEDAWADCAEKAILGWRLPDPKGGIAKLAVRYRPSAT